MASGEISMTQSGTEGSHNGSAGPSASRGKKLCDGVYSLHEPGGQPEVEVVFIHGLQSGDPKDAYDNAYWTTWLGRDGSRDNCWPRTWLAAVFPKARVLTIKYDASRALKSTSSGAMDLHPFGETLVQEMVFSGVDIGQHGCPVIFVCHCLGGLIAKKIVVLGHERFKGDKRIEKLLKNIKAFVFYATPHGGSDLVKMNPDLARLNSTFEAIQRKVYNNKCKFRVVAEAHETSSRWFSSSMIVEEHSVRYAGFDRIIHVAADHFNVCKPETIRSTSFLQLTGCIEEVVAEYQSNQDKISGLPTLVVGVDAKLVSLRKKLKERPVVGLVGMGGVGKTTLSKALFNRERGNYDKCCYLEDVKSHSNVVDFQKQLLRELCDEEWNKSEEPKDYDLRIVRQCIQTKKVLVVIDDVGTEKNLKALQVEAFQHGSSGSRVIVTCRNKAILSDYHMSEGDNIEVDVLDLDQSMELFRHYAFHAFNDVHELGSEERDKFEDEAVNIVHACGGLPLSLEVIGQHLRKRNHLPGDERLDWWKEALKRLNKAKALDDGEEKLWSTLKISYDDLKPFVKGFFIDFACILCDAKNLESTTTGRLWDSHAGLQTLIDSSLIKVVEQNSGLFGLETRELVMHDQLRDMGRWIVRELAHKDVPKRIKHIWEKDVVKKFFEDEEESSTLEGLSMMNMERLELQKPHLFQVILSMICPRKYTHYYPKLRLLNLSCMNIHVVKVVLGDCLIYTQNLRWLSLNMTPIKKDHLKILNASVKTLCVLHMRYCWELVELPSSIGDLSSLKELDLYGCENLRSLPETIGLKLGNLQVLILTRCKSLMKLPESLANLVQLLELHLVYCRLKRLPSGLGNLKRLKVLNLRNCCNLTEVPAGVGQMLKLETLLLCGCDSLQTMCEFDTKMHHLHTLGLSECRRLTSLKSLGNLYRLRMLDLGGCILYMHNLAESVGQLHELQYLDLGRMEKEVAEMLREGHLHGDHLEHLVISIIPEAALPSCPRLKYLWLCDRWCGKAKEPSNAFSESLGNLVQLHELHMNKVASVPESVGNLTQLKELYVKRSGRNPLPDALRNLVGLQILHVNDSQCERLPECVGDLVSLRVLSLAECGELVELPSSLGRLSQLRTLNLRYCKNLERLPESLGLLTQLRELNLGGCQKLEGLPDSVLGLTQLTQLNIEQCYKLTLKEEVRHALTERGCRIRDRWNLI
ncbi:hypothetical protein KC19_8G062900 [Ceratodon purpureus]|uniref:NB-ARC domain-containing protein n=1 Tax=Ceratodon purpureus TaxID=3225 RepID=A0A8T0GZH6_CERPU|nr:hypothetical protein KC19_8G062900 [Ceratodon purpureus]